MPKIMKLNAKLNFAYRMLPFGYLGTSVYGRIAFKYELKILTFLYANNVSTHEY